MPLPLVRALPAVLFGALVLVTAGCESARHEDGQREAATRVAPAKPLRGQSLFFTGKLLAEATVSRGLGPGFDHHGGGSGGGGGGGRHGGGMGRHGGGRGMGGGNASTTATDDDNGDSGSAHTMNPMSRSLPPVTLRLRLKNQSTEALDVHILDVKSDLGDFVAQPEHLLLAPDQSAEIDPMFSQLGVPTDGFAITVRLRAGDKTETQPLVLHTVVQARDSTADQPRP